MEREQRTGLIDTISAGYGLVNRLPWLIAVPLVLDLFLWLGPHLSVQPLLDSMVVMMADQGEVSPDLTAAMQQLAAQSDLLNLLALWMPSIMQRGELVQAPALTPRLVWLVTDPVLAVVAAVGLSLVGLLVFTAFIVPVGQVVRGEPLTLERLAREALIGWGRLVGLVSLVVVGLLAVALVMAVLVAGLALAGVNLAPLVLFVLNIGMVWLLIYLFFAIAAIVVSRVGPLAAIRYSVAVVRRNFWTSVGLIVLKLVISYGLLVVLGAIARFPIGAPVAIAASAYIGTGLEAAVLLFYRERLARWEQQRVSALGMPRPGAPR